MKEANNKNNDTNLTKIKTKINTLKKKIAKWNIEYYTLDNPSVSDEKYDLAYDELLLLEKQYPQFLTADSPTQKVGSSTSSLFEKFEHKTPMLSLEKATTKDEIIKFYNNIIKTTKLQKPSFTLEHKIDGLSVALHYEQGKLVKGVTRGDGKIGEDLTENILQISDVKKTIPYLEKIEIRGEVFIEKKLLPIINEKLKKEFEDKQNQKLEVWKQEQKNYENYVVKLEEWEILNDKYLTKLEKYKQEFEEWSKHKKHNLEQNTLFGDFNDVVEPIKPVKPEKPKAVNNPKQMPKIGSYKQLANVRNAASGTLRQKDSSVVKDRNLSVILYEIVDPLEHKIKTQIEALEFLKKLGLPTQSDYKVFDDINVLFDEITSFKAEKGKLEYDTDGAVVKLNDFSYWHLLGTTAKFPKYAIAFKYPAKEFISTIIDIKTTVGRTGKITYVADIEPVEINETIVAKATLNNWNYIDGLGLNIGDKIKLIKSGEIIPKIIDLVEKNSEGIFPKTEKCPSCNAELGYWKDNVDQFCLNDNCEQKNINSLIYAASREALNIVSLGKKNIELFYKKGYIKDVYDFFNLKNFYNEISSLEFFKDKKTKLIIDGIEKARNTKLFRVICALCIDEVGVKASIELAKVIKNLEDLIYFNFDELEKINNMGEAIIGSLKEFVSIPKNVTLIRNLASILNIDNSSVDVEIKSKIFEGLKFVITGTLSNPRDYYNKIILENSGQIEKNVTANTSYLISSKQSGTKFSKAKELNVKIISEEEFNNMLNNNSK